MLLKFPADISIRNRSAARDQVTQLVQQDVILHHLLEHRYAQIGVLQDVLVLLLAYKIAAGKERRRIASVLQFVPHLVIRGPHSKPLCLADDDLPADEVLSGALGKVWQQRRDLLATAWELLPQQLLGLALHFKSAHRFARDAG